MPPNGHLIHGSEQEIAEHVVEDIAEALGDVASFGGQIYAWSTMHWAALGRSQIFGFIKPYDGFEYGELKHRLRPIKLSNQKIEAIEKLIVRNTDQPGFFDAPTAGIPCQNGIIQFKEGEAKLLPHHPDHRNRHVLPVTWDGKIVDEPPGGSLLKRYLDGVFADDDDAGEKRAVLAEIAGVALAGCATEIAAPKAIVLHGSSAENGKSQYQNLLRGLVPANAQVTLSPSMLSSPRNVATLDGAVLVSASEIGGKAIASEELKAAITGDPMLGCPLYKAGYTVIPKALHVYSTNTLPGFTSGMDAGVRRRLLVVTFNRVIPFEGRIEKIGARIAEFELDLVFAWAVGGWLQVMNQGDFSRLASSDDAVKDWILVSDPFECWLNDPMAVLVTGIETDRLIARGAFSAYRKWAELEGLRDTSVGTQTRFTQRLREFSGRGIQVRKSNRGNVIHGLKLVGGSASPKGAKP